MPCETVCSVARTVLAQGRGQELTNSALSSELCRGKWESQNHVDSTEDSGRQAFIQCLSFSNGQLTLDDINTLGERPLTTPPTGQQTEKSLDWLAQEQGRGREISGVINGRSRVCIPHSSFLSVLITSSNTLTKTRTSVKQSFGISPQQLHQERPFTNTFHEIISQSIRCSS